MSDIEKQLDALFKKEAKRKIGETTADHYNRIDDLLSTHRDVLYRKRVGETTGQYIGRIALYQQTLSDLKAELKYGDALEQQIRIEQARIEARVAKEAEVADQRAEAEVQAEKAEIEAEDAKREYNSFIGLICVILTILIGFAQHILPIWTWVIVSAYLSILVIGLFLNSSAIRNNYYEGTGSWIYVKYFMRWLRIIAVAFETVRTASWAKK